MFIQHIIWKKKKYFIILDKGKIIAQGTSDELKKEANIEEKIERVGPTLNDVFLKLTGKELRD